MILEEQEIPKERLVAAIRKATLDLQLTPVLCGSSFKNKGVQPLLDAVIDFLPSPLDVPPVRGLEPVKGEEDREAVRKRRRRAVRGARVQDHGRPLRRQAHLLPRVLGQARGRLARAQRHHRAHERIGRILMMHANDREDVHEVYAGDIAAAVGIKQVVTGDTLAAPDKPIKLETITFPEPVITVAIEPKTKADQEKMSVALGRLAEEDPTFQVRDQRGDRPDRDLRHGRAAPRGAGRPHVARVQGRRQRRPPAGLLPRDHERQRPEVRGQHVKPDRRLGPVRHRLHRHRAGAGRGFDFENEIKGGSIPTSSSPGREGRPGALRPG